MSKKVSIVLVNYNGKEYLNDLLESIEAQDYEDVDVVLVDNGSTDDSVAWLKENYAKLSLLEAEHNEGFGEGCNVGIDYALEHGAEYILLLNTDTVIEKNLVSELVKYADTDTVTTATIYCGEIGEKQLWYSGGKINFVTANTEQLIYGENDRNPTYQVDFISGCCMLLHKSLFEKVGKFDKKFFLYYEDADFCVRMKNANITMLYLTTTSLWHKVGGSSVGGSETSCSTQYYVTRNRLLFAEKHANLFKDGNIGILREILQERDFFAGANNEKYKLYVMAAIADFFKKDFGRGVYGKTLLEERIYVLDGLYDREGEKDTFWYCAGERSTDIVIVNPQKRNVVYNVSFDVAREYDEDASLQITIEGKMFRSCRFPEHVEFMLFVEAEQKAKMNLQLLGDKLSKTRRSDGNYSYYQLLNIKVVERNVSFYLGKSFLSKESNETSEWYWSSERNGDIYLINNSDELVVDEVKFSVVPCERNEAEVITILQDGEVIAEAEPEKELNYRVPVKPKSTSRLTICTDLPIERGERSLCFNVNNLSVASIKNDFYFGNEFGVKESDDVSEWCWSSEKNGDIYLVNNSDELVVEEVKFSVIPWEKNETEVITILQDGEVIAEAEPEKELNYRVTVKPKSVSELTISTDWPVYKGERRLCFNVKNLKAECIKDSFYLGNTFYSKENDEYTAWYWSKEQTGDIFIINRSHRMQIKRIEFSVMPYAQCKNAIIEILQEGKETIRVSPMERITHMLEIPANSVIRLTVRGNMPVCAEKERNLCFNINNLLINLVEKYVNFENTFYAQESNGVDTWNWACEQEAEISFVLNEAKESKLSFCLGCLPEFEQESVELILDGASLGEFAYNQEISVLLKPDANIGIHCLKFKASHEPFHVEGDSRKFVFQVINFDIAVND